MNEHPILYSTPMVQAILEGRKTITRRKLKVKGCKPFSPKPEEWTISEIERWNEGYYPYGQVGDVLWVRETFYAYGHWTRTTEVETGKTEWHFNDLTVDNGFSYCFEDSKPELVHKKRGCIGWYKRPSIFMPKAIARIWLKITSVKVERLQTISEEDAKAEGIKFHSLFSEYGGVVPHPNRYVPDNFRWYSNPVDAFNNLWISINGEENFKSNPWVWAIEFEVLSTTGKPAAL